MAKKKKTGGLNLMALETGAPPPPCRLLANLFWTDLTTSRIQVGDWMGMAVDRYHQKKEEKKQQLL